MKISNRTQLWKCASGVAFVIAVACSDSSGPQALTTGVYAYSSNLPFFKSDGSLGTSRFEGMLTLTFVSNDSIAGTWQVVGVPFSPPAFRPDATLGLKNQDAYVLNAHTTPSGSLIPHRIRPDLGCTAKYAGPDPYGTCTLTKQ